MANKDLWLLVDELNTVHDITWRHVKGHSGDEGNELADMLANRGADGESGYEDFSVGTEPQ